MQLADARRDGSGCDRKLVGKWNEHEQSGVSELSRVVTVSDFGIWSYVGSDGSKNGDANANRTGRAGGRAGGRVVLSVSGTERERGTDDDGVICLFYTRLRRGGGRGEARRGDERENKIEYRSQRGTTSLLLLRVGC